MFDCLSEETQGKVLAFKGVKTKHEANWDVIPVGYLPYGTIEMFEQEDIDLQALTQLGYYRNV